MESKGLCVICRQKVPKDLILWKALGVAKFQAVQSATLRCFNLSEDPYIGESTVTIMSYRPYERQKGIYCGECRKVNQELFHLLQDLAAVEKKIDEVMSSVKEEFKKTFLCIEDLEAQVENSTGLSKGLNAARLQMAKCSDIEVKRIYHRLPQGFDKSEAIKHIIPPRGKIHRLATARAGPACSKNIIKKPMYLLPIRKAPPAPLYGKLDPIRNVQFGPKITKEQNEARIHKVPGLSIHAPVSDPYETGENHGDEDWNTLIPEINFDDFNDDGDPMEVHHAESFEPKKRIKTEKPLYTPREEWLLKEFGIPDCMVSIEPLDEKVIAALGVKEHKYTCLFDDCLARKDFTLFDRNRHLEEEHGMAQEDIVSLDAVKRGNIFEDGVAKVFKCNATDCTGYGPFTSIKELNQHKVMYHKPEAVPLEAFEDVTTNRISLRPKRSKKYINLEESESEDEKEIMEIPQEDGVPEKQPINKPVEEEDSDWEPDEQEIKQDPELEQPGRIYSRCIFSECYGYGVYRTLTGLLEHIHKIHELPLTAEELPDLIAANNSLVEEAEVPPPPKAYQCYFADCSAETEFASEADLDQHVKEAHADGIPKPVPKVRTDVKYSCTVFGCSRKFDDFLDRRSHYSDAHNSLAGYVKCDTCKTRFPTEEEMEAHKKDKHQEKRFSCHICGNRFLNRSSCEAHIEKHSLPPKPKPIYQHKREQLTCDRCGNTYTKRQALIRHMIAIHEDRRDFSCDQCGKQFHFKTQLQDHIKLVHIGTKDQMCGICGKGFVLKKHLINHERRTHKITKDGKPRIKVEVPSTVEVNESAAAEGGNPTTTTEVGASAAVEVGGSSESSSSIPRKRGRPSKKPVNQSSQNGSPRRKRKAEETVTRDFAAEVDAAIEELTSSSQHSQESAASSCHPVDLTDWGGFGGIPQHQHHSHQNYNQLNTPNPYMSPKGSISPAPVTAAASTYSSTFVSPQRQQQYIPQPSIFTNAAGFPRLQNHNASQHQPSVSSLAQGGIQLSHLIGSQPGLIPPTQALFQQPNNVNIQNVGRNPQSGYFGYNFQ